MRVATKWLCGLLVAVMALTSPLLSRAAMVHAAELSSEASPVDADVSDSDRVGAGFLNVVYVPGKAIVCGLGTAYRAAIDTYREGCGGTWVLTPEHVAGKIPPQEDIE